MLLLAFAAQAAAVPPLPDQAQLYRVLFADIHTTLQSGHAETGLFVTWTQGYDVNIGNLDCRQNGAGANCRFRLTRTPDGTPRDVHAGTRINVMGCRAELRYGRGPNGAAEAWRVRTWPGPNGTPARSTMRCTLDRGA
jgi:hypothetical protein